MPIALKDVAIVLSFLNARGAKSEVLFDYRDVAREIYPTLMRRGALSRLDASRRTEICCAMRAVARAANAVPGWVVAIEPECRFLTLRARRVLAPGALGQLASAAQ